MNKKTEVRKFHLQCLGIILLACLPVAAFADLESTLTAFSTLLTGTIGKTVAGIALIGVGFACFGMGKVPKSYVIAVVVGIGIIFGAAAIVNTLAGA